MPYPLERREVLRAYVRQVLEDPSQQQGTSARTLLELLHQCVPPEWSTPAPCSRPSPPPSMQQAAPHGSTPAVPQQHAAREDLLAPSKGSPAAPGRPHAGASSGSGREGDSRAVLPLQQHTLAKLVHLLVAALRAEAARRAQPRPAVRGPPPAPAPGPGRPTGAPAATPASGAGAGTSAGAAAAAARPWGGDSSGPVSDQAAFPLPMFPLLPGAACSHGPTPDAFDPCLAAQLLARLTLPGGCLGGPAVLQLALEVGAQPALQLALEVGAQQVVPPALGAGSQQVLPAQGGEEPQQEVLLAPTTSPCSAQASAQPLQDAPVGVGEGPGRSSSCSSSSSSLGGSSNRAVAPPDAAAGGAAMGQKWAFSAQLPIHQPGQLSQHCLHAELHALGAPAHELCLHDAQHNALAQLAAACMADAGVCLAAGPLLVRSVSQVCLQPPSRL